MTISIRYLSTKLKALLTSREIKRNVTLPKLSIVVVCFNMRREAPRTLYTLSHHFQLDVSENDYEIIVVDNGSTSPLDKESIEAIADNVSYYFYDTASKSPAAAVNYGSSLAKGKYLACVVDGARMVTPGIVRYSLLACENSISPYVTVLAWHLGPNEQNLSMLEGYDQKEEDVLLDSVDWKNNGYELFEISSQAASSRMGIMGGLPYESSFFAILKSKFDDLGGFDERFVSPGGGLVNHAFLNTVIETQGFDYVVLLGEGSFHQFHGGIAANAMPSEHPMQLFLDEYEGVYNQPYETKVEMVNQDVCYLGKATRQSLKFLTKGSAAD